MVSSDSDSDSECFESAEESLDEKEIERKPRSKKNSKESESEVAEPVVNDEVLETLVKDDSSNFQSFRKRRERVKRTPSIPSPKVASRNKNSSETLFRTDVADVFFQDITSNLSKNINKSLHTLQQTSSNVKDLILSSLPASSVSEKEGFVYDDGFDVLPPPVDDKELSLETSIDKTVGSSKLAECLPVKKDEVKETPNVQSNDSKIFDWTEKVDSENIEIDSNTAEIPDSENPHLSNSEDDQEIKKFSKLESDVPSNIEQDNNFKTHRIEKKLENSSKCSLSDEISKPLKFDSENSFNTEENGENPCKSSVNISSQDNINSHNLPAQKPEEDKYVNSNLSKSIVPSFTSTEVDNTNDTCSSENNTEILKDQECSDLSNENTEFNVDCKNLSQEKKSIKEENLKTQEYKEEKTLSENSEGLCNTEVDFVKVDEGKSSCNSVMNESELRIDKGKEVIAKQSEIEDKNEKKENRSLDIECNPNESTDHSDEKFTDGWDDFDFSDNEIENNNMEEVNKSEKSDKSQNTGDLTVKQQISIQPSDKTSTNSEVQKPTKTIPSNKCVKEENTVGGKREVKETSEKENFDDSWNWESWDDEENTTENQKETDQKTKIKSSEKARNIPEDIGQWSGWDTFGQKNKRNIEEEQGNWNLGSWGVNLLLNKATAVTQGLSNVLEAGLGAPDPETLARIQKEEEKQLKQKIEKMKNNEEPEESPKRNSVTGVNLFPVSGITNLVAGVTSKIVDTSKIQEIGSKVLSGGLDTLETFGKKTMEVLQDGDPGLRNKRALLLGNDKPVLSQILREAREKADKEIRQVEQQALAKKCHFEILFDDYQGMVHLEALEMLSRQYELKIEQLKSGMSSEELEDLEGVLEEVEQLCALDDLDLNSSMLDFKTSLQMALEPLKEEISVQKIIQIQDKANKWLETSSEVDPPLMTLHQKAVSTVAELTAATVHEFLKAGELLSVKECRKTVDEIDALAKLTNILCTEINQVCGKFILIAEKQKSVESAKTIIEKITVMRDNANSYIKQAFNLLIPILQAGAAF